MMAGHLPVGGVSNLSRAVDALALVFLIVWGLAIPLPAHADDSPDPVATAAFSSAPKTAPAASGIPDLAERKARLDAFNPAMPEAPGQEAAVDSKTQVAYLAALQAYYAYRIQGMKDFIDLEKLMPGTEIGKDCRQRTV